MLNRGAVQNRRSRGEPDRGRYRLPVSGLAHGVGGGVEIRVIVVALIERRGEPAAASTRWSWSTAVSRCRTASSWPTWKTPASIWSGAEGAFRWRDPDFGDFPLTLATPPTPEVCTAILAEVGEQAKSANRVEVPFDSVAPTPEGNVDHRQPRRHRRAARPFRCNRLPAADSWQGHIPACPHRRQDRFGQVDAAARAHHAARGARTVPRKWNCTSSTSRKASSSKPTPVIICRTPVSWP